MKGFCSLKVQGEGGERERAERRVPLRAWDLLKTLILNLNFTPRPPKFGVWQYIRYAKRIRVRQRPPRAGCVAAACRPSAGRAPFRHSAGRGQGQPALPARAQRGRRLWPRHLPGQAPSPGAFCRRLRGSGKCEGFKNNNNNNKRASGGSHPQG